MELVPSGTSQAKVRPVLLDWGGLALLATTFQMSSQLVGFVACRRLLKLGLLFSCDPGLCWLACKRGPKRALNGNFRCIRRTVLVRGFPFLNWGSTLSSTVLRIHPKLPLIRLNFCRVSDLGARSQNPGPSQLGLAFLLQGELLCGGKAVLVRFKASILFLPLTLFAVLVPSAALGHRHCKAPGRGRALCCC